MRIIRRATETVAVLLFLVAVFGPMDTAFGQSGRIGTGVANRKNFGFYWETRMEPPTAAADNFTSMTSSATNAPDTVLRIVGDRSRRVYVAYAADVQVLLEANTYRLTLRQLDAETAKGLPGLEAGVWTPLPTPGWGTAAPRTVRGGDVVAIDLLTNSAGQKVVDYITVQEVRPVTFGTVNSPPREFAFASGSPRDFQADDVEMRIRDPRLSVNGKLEENTSKITDAAEGAVVCFYAGRRGRYILSLTPHPELGFRKAGEVRGSSLTFTVGSDTFRLVSAGKIAPGQAAFNLYVLHDPTWRPAYPFANLDAFILDAADRPEWLLKK